MSGHQEPLSNEGEARRRAMLSDLQGEMTHLHRNRRRRRSTAGLALCAIVIGAIFLSVLPQSRPSTQPVLAKHDVPSKIDIAPVTASSIIVEPIGSGGIRMVAISTDDVLQAFADVRVAAGIRCDSSGAQCEVFFPGRSADDGSILR